MTTTVLIIQFIVIPIIFALLSFIEHYGFRVMIVLILLLAYYANSINYINNPNKPKYYINDKVMLPDSTYGKIDSVAYKIEGNWYNQKVLK